jgi:hypothetical protein
MAITRGSSWDHAAPLGLGRDYLGLMGYKHAVPNGIFI